MLTNAPKGTKDMLPEQAYKWHYVEKAFADQQKSFLFYFSKILYKYKYLC